MPEAPAVTTTATSTAQETPKAVVEPKKTEAPVQAAPAPKPEAPPEVKKVEEPAKPATEPAKEEVKAEAKPEAEKEVVYDIPLPEGALITKEDVSSITAFAKAEGYSNDQAKAVAHFQDLNKVRAKELVEKTWMEECKNHPVYGKDKFPETSQKIKVYLERVAPKLIPLLDTSGLGNKVEVYEYLAEQASRGTDDTLVSGRQAVTQDNRTTMQKIADDFNARHLKK